MKLTNKTITYTQQEVDNLRSLMEDKEMSKGAAIRKLFAEGFDVKSISEALGIRYNHVYNVVQNEVLVHALEVERSGRGNSGGKKIEALELLEAGKSIREVSEELRMLYNSVWQIAKAAGLTNKQRIEAAIDKIPEQAAAEVKKSKKSKTEVA